MSKVEMGTLYDMNKSIMQNQKKLSENAINNKMKEMIPFFNEGTYYMMLCHERRDYTVFCRAPLSSLMMLFKDLKECLENRGEILSIDKTKDNKAYEIWIRNIEGTFAYYFFHYDEGVIEC